MVGMSERTTGVVCRRQPAGSLLPLVISFGEPLEIDELSDAAGAGRAYRSFVSGFSTGHARTRFERGQDCVQVFLTPLGLRRVLGVPGEALARQVVDVDTVAPAMGDALGESLASVATWAERFAMVETALLRQVGRHVEPPPWVSWMWRQLDDSGGRARIADLVEQTGWSHRHVAKGFGAEIGLSPKQAAGIIRFERAASELGRVPLAEIAVRHGYADQSHLTRAMVRYAGETPREHAVAQRPTPWTALGLEFAE